VPQVVKADAFPAVVEPRPIPRPVHCAQHVPGRVWSPRSGREDESIGLYERDVSLRLPLPMCG
jgi:hypothetical protein